jgi:hypothetical protein
MEKEAGNYLNWTRGSFHAGLEQGLDFFARFVYFFYPVSERRLLVTLGGTALLTGIQGGWGL